MMNLAKTNFGNRNSQNYDSVGDFKKLSNNMPKSIYEALIGVVSAYGETPIMEAMDDIVKKMPNAKRFSLKSFGMGNYFVQYLYSDETKRAQTAIDRAKSKNLNITNYECNFVSDKYTNKPFLITLPEGFDAIKYQNNWSLENCDKSAAKELYGEIEMLAKEGVAIPRANIYYNNDAKDFKLLSYKDVYIDGFSSAEEKQKYLDAYQYFCGVKL